MYKKLLIGVAFIAAIISCVPAAQKVVAQAIPTFSPTVVPTSTMFQPTPRATTTVDPPYPVPTTTTSMAPYYYTTAPVSPVPKETVLLPGTPPPSSDHIATYVYDEYNAESSQVSATNTSAPSPAQVQAYVNYAEGGYGNTKAVNDCDQNGTPGVCQSVFYSDSNFMYAYSAACPNVPNTAWVNYFTANDELAFLHLKGYSDSAHRIAGSYTYNCAGTSTAFPVYALNQNDATVQSYLNSYFQTNIDGGGWDIQFQDDTKTTVTGQGYGPSGSFCKTLASYCFVTNTSYINEWQGTTAATVDALVQAEHRAYFAAMVRSNGSYRPQIYNGVCGTPNCIDGSDETEIMTGGVNNPLGAECESCFDNHGSLTMANVPYILNTMLHVNNLGRLFILEDYDTSTDANQVSNRVASAALIWLGFYPSSTVWWENDEYDTKFMPVWPEELIVPTQPIQSMTSGSTDLQVATGVYRREFAQCYQGGMSIGPCAALLNTTSSAITEQASWLTQTYGHSISLSGGDVLGGGTLNVAGATFTSGATIPADSGVLITQ